LPPRKPANRPSAKAKRVVLNNNPNGKQVHDPVVVENTTEMIPPADLFHRFTNYFETNYEELRDVVQDLYCEKPDLERAINPYQWYTPGTPEVAKFKNVHDAADNFIDKHKDEVIAAIYTADSNKWNLFGPFKQVRDRVRFYNSNTIVLEEMMKQIEMDGRLGKDLMMKKVAKKKRENIERDGPDDPAFVKWKRQNAALKAMGAVSLDDEVPDDAIEVPMFKISNGGQNIVSDAFYSEAEAPEVNM